MSKIEGDQMTELIQRSELDLVPAMPDYEAWLDVRRQSVGASEVAAVLGCARYGTPYSVWAAKTRALSDYPTSEMARGNRAEDTICSWFRNRVWAWVQGDQRADLDRARRIWRHRDYPRVHATPDGLIVLSGTILALVEAKSVGDHYAFLFGRDGTADVPYDVWVQVQVQLACIASWTGHALDGYVAAIIGDELGKETGWRWYRIPYDEAEATRLCRAADRWYELYVEADVLPPVDGSPAAERMLRDTYPEVQYGDKDRLADASPEVESIAIRYRDETAKLKRLEDSCAALKQQLMAEIGDCAGIQGDGWRITWLQAKETQRTDWQAAWTRLIDRAGVDGNLAREVLAESTSTHPGSRRFLPRWRA